MSIKQLMITPQRWLNKLNVVDFLGPLALRLFLVPVFWTAGITKLASIHDVAAWFGNPDWGLGLPFPLFMAYAAALTEFLGAIMLLLGIGVRWIAIPLMIVMIVAAFGVHWDHGWTAIAEQGSQAASRLQNFLTWLSQEYPGRHAYITELGEPVMLNNGVEYAVTYFIMLLNLMFFGAGKYLSLDHWINCWLHRGEQ